MIITDSIKKGHGLRTRESLWWCDSSLRQEKKNKCYFLWIVILKHLNGFLFIKTIYASLKTTINKEDNPLDWLHVSPGMNGGGMKRKSNNPHSSQTWATVSFYCRFISGTINSEMSYIDLQLAWPPYESSLNVSSSWGKCLRGMLRSVRREDAVTRWTGVTAAGSRQLLHQQPLPVKIAIDVKRVETQRLSTNKHTCTHTHTHQYR